MNDEALDIFFGKPCKVQCPEKEWKLFGRKKYIQIVILFLQPISHGLPGHFYIEFSYFCILLCHFMVYTLHAAHVSRVLQHLPPWAKKKPWDNISHPLTDHGESIFSYCLIQLSLNHHMTVKRQNPVSVRHNSCHIGLLCFHQTRLPSPSLLPSHILSCATCCPLGKRGLVTAMVMKRVVRPWGGVGSWQSLWKPDLAQPSATLLNTPMRNGQNKIIGMHSHSYSELKEMTSTLQCEYQILTSHIFISIMDCESSLMPVV